MISCPIPVTRLARLWARGFALGGPDECWAWTGKTLDKDGYGRIVWLCEHCGRRHRTGAHRVAWMVGRGPIPPGLTIDHRCVNVLCQNSNHMQLVTRVVNARLMKLRRTHCPHGHPYSGENLQIAPSGQRKCRACVAAANLRHRQRLAGMDVPLLQQPRRQGKVATNG